MNPSLETKQASQPLTDLPLYDKVGSTFNWVTSLLLSNPSGPGQDT